MGGVTIERLDATGARLVLSGLADVLIDCVEGGASVGFLWPLTHERAVPFWKNVADGVERGERILLVARDESGEPCGTVNLVLAQMENQPHRAEVTKLLVHRRMRRRGVGELLMQEIERAALAVGKTLLVLDTASDDAVRLYERAGWSLSGVIPGYALNPDGSLCDTRMYWKSLAAE